MFVVKKRENLSFLFTFYLFFDKIYKGSDKMIPITSVLTILSIFIFLFIGYLSYLQSNKQNIKIKKELIISENNEINRDDLINVINFYKKDYSKKYEQLINILKTSNDLLNKFYFNDIPTDIFYTYFTPYIKYMKKKKILSNEELNTIISDINNINKLMEQELKKKLMSEYKIIKIEFDVIQNEVKEKLEIK